jgi:hypothetical protein
MRIARSIFAAFAIAVILVAAYVVVGGLLGLPVFKSNINNERKAELVGCYQWRGTTVFRVAMPELSLGGNEHLPYQVVSDKMGLAVLPSRLLRADMSNPAAPKIIAAARTAELIPYNRDRAALTFTTTDGGSVSFGKAKC